MKQLTVCPIVNLQGRNIEAILELSYDETWGLMELIQDALKDAAAGKPLTLVFHNSLVTLYDPKIECLFEFAQDDE